MKTKDYNRITVVGFYEVINSSPQGDPNNGNLPRQNFYTNHGYATRALLTRDVRDRMEMLDHAIFLKSGKTVENTRDESHAAHDKSGIDPNKYFVDTYIDSMFGAVLGATKNKKAIQLYNYTAWANFSMSESVDPITIISPPITNETSNQEKANTPEGRERENKEFGMTADVVSYGVYKFCVTFDLLAARLPTGLYRLSEERIQRDVDLVRQCLIELFQHKLSGKKSMIGLRSLEAYYAPIGAQASTNVNTISDAVVLTRKDPNVLARRYSDYTMKRLSREQAEECGLEHETWFEDMIAKMMNEDSGTRKAA